MSAITFPNSPSAGEQWTINGITYTFTDGTWVAVGQSNFYSLPIASPTTLGGIKGGGTDIDVANDGVVSFSGTLPGPKTFTFTVTGNGKTTVVDPQTGLSGSVGDYTITGSDRRGIVSGTNPTIHINEEDTVIFNVSSAGQEFRLVAATAATNPGGEFIEIGDNSSSNAPTGQPTTSGTVTWVSKVLDGFSLYDGGAQYYYQDCDQDFLSNPTTYKSGTILVFHKDTPEGKSDWLELNDTPNSYAGQAGKFTKVTANEDGLEFTTVTGGEVTIQNSGVDLATAATTINFDGAGVTATGTGAVKTITIPGASGGTTTTINNNAANRLITGSGTTDTLNAESNITYGALGTGILLVSGDLVVDNTISIDGNYIKRNSTGINPSNADLHIQGDGTGGTYHLTLDDHVAVAGDITIKYGLKDKDSDLGSPGQILSSTGTQVDWIDASAASGGSSVSQTVYSGNVVRQLDAPVAIGMSAPHDNGYTGFTDVGTYPQTLPVYSNSAGGTEVTANPMLNALDGDTDTYADMSAYDGSSNWSKITFTNPLGLRSDGSKEITSITIGYDGTGHFGYNGGNLTTTGTETGVVKEMNLYSGGFTAIQLDNLYFVSPTVNDKCHVYYVYLNTNDVSSHGGTKLTVNKHDIIPGSSATGQNGFILHNTGDVNTDPAGLKLQLTAGTANTVVGVKTDQPRYLVLPLGSTCSLGDKITVMDLGIGYWQNYPYVNERWNPGNATTNPILIFPHDEDGIQGTVRHESYSSTRSAMYQNRFDQANFFGTEDKGLVNQPFHGTPLGISRNGESISVIWCGHEFGWRYLP